MSLSTLGVRSTDLGLSAEKSELMPVWLGPEEGLVTGGVGKVSTGAVGIGVSLINVELAKKLGIPVVVDCDVVGFGTLNKLGAWDEPPNNVEVGAGLLFDVEGIDADAGTGAGFCTTAGLAKLKGNDVKGGSFAFSNSAERSGPAVYRNREVSQSCNDRNPMAKLTSLANENPTGSANS